MKVSVYVACHKKIVKPFYNRFLKYMEVGRYYHKRGFLKLNDSSKKGATISYKNQSYNELTAAYWIWKNDKRSDIVGLWHYRRYFGIINNYGEKTLLTSKQIIHLLSEYDMLVMKRIIFNISCRERITRTNKSALREKDIAVVKEVLLFLHGEKYTQALDKILDRNFEYFCNMLVCNKKLFDSYCEWLFPILEELESRIDYGELVGQEKRIYGLWGEYLLNTYIEANNIKIKECETIFVENTSLFKNLKKKIKKQLEQLKGRLRTSSNSY